jgi:hypothetical protein
MTLTGLLILAVWTAWPAVFMVAALSILALIWGTTRQRLTVIVWGGLAMIAFISMMIYYEAVHPGAFDSLMSTYLWRTSDASLRVGSQPFTWLQWLAVNIEHLLAFGTLGVLMLAGVGVYALWQHSSRQGLRLFLALFGGGALYLVFFRNAAFVHDYYKTWLMPSVALAAAAALVWVRPRLGSFSAVIDMMTVLFVLQTVFVMSLLMSTFQQPVLDATLAYIKTNIASESPLLITNEAWELRRGYDHIIAFYTERDVYLNQSLADVRAQTTEPIIHIDCHQAEHDSAQPIAIIADTCIVWRYDGVGED